MKNKKTWQQWVHIPMVGWTLAAPFCGTFLNLGVPSGPTHFTRLPWGLEEYEFDLPCFTKWGNWILERRRDFSWGHKDWREQLVSRVWFPVLCFFWRTSHGPENQESSAWGEGQKPTGCQGPHTEWNSSSRCNPPAQPLHLLIPTPARFGNPLALEYVTFSLRVV